MKVTVVGTSCTWFTRNNTSFIIDDDIILDMPEGSYKDIAKCIDVFKVNSILISHLHGDHFPDLHIIATLIMRSKQPRAEKLKVYGPKGMLKELIKLNKLFHGGKDEIKKKSFLPYIDFIDIADGDTFSVGKYNVKVYRMNHGKVETYGFVFTEENGKVVAFSSDTKYCENLQNMVSGSDVAFVDFASMAEYPSHVCKDEFHKLLYDNPKTKIYPVHTNDKTQEYVEQNKLNPLKDGQVIKI